MCSIGNHFLTNVSSQPEAHITSHPRDLSSPPSTFPPISVSKPTRRNYPSAHAYQPAGHISSHEWGNLPRSRNHSTPAHSPTASLRSDISVAGYHSGCGGAAQLQNPKKQYTDIRPFPTIDDINHLEKLNSTHKAYLAVRGCLKAASLEVSLIRTHQYRFYRVLKDSINRLAGLWVKVRRLDPHSQDAERLRLDIRKRVLLVRWLILNREETTKDARLREGLSHWFLLMFKHRLLHKVALDEGTFSVLTTKLVLDIKVANFYQATAETARAARHLANINVPAPELRAAIRHPAVASARGVTKLSHRQFIYREMVKTLDRHVFTAHNIYNLFRASTSILQNLTLLERGLFGYLHIKSLTDRFTHFLLVMYGDEARAGGTSSYKWIASSNPLVVGIAESFGRIMRDFSIEIRSLISDFRLALFRGVKQMETSRALLPHAMHIRRDTLRVLKNIQFCNSELAITALGPVGYTPLRCYRGVYARSSSIATRREQRQARPVAQRHQILPTPNPPPERPAARREFLHMPRDSGFKTSLRPQSAASKRYTAIESGRTRSGKERITSEGTASRKMAYSTHQTQAQLALGNQYSTEPNADGGVKHKPLTDSLFAGANSGSAADRNTASLSAQPSHVHASAPNLPARPPIQEGPVAHLNHDLNANIQSYHPYIQRPYNPPTCSPTQLQALHIHGSSSSSARPNPSPGTLSYGHQRILRNEQVARRRGSFDQNGPARKYWKYDDIVRYQHKKHRRDAVRRIVSGHNPEVQKIFLDSQIPDCEKQSSLAHVDHGILKRTTRPRAMCAVSHTPLFGFPEQRRHRAMRVLLRQSPPIVHSEWPLPTLLLPILGTTIARLSNILENEGPIATNNDVKAIDAGVREKTGRHSKGGRARLNPTPRMRAPHPLNFSSETRMIHSTSSICASPATLENNGKNSRESTGFDTMPDSEKQLPFSNSDMSQESNYAADEASSESDAESVTESEVDEEGGIHIPLSFQIPPESLRAAMQASPNSQASYYSHQLYRGLEDEKLLVHYCHTMDIAERVSKYFLDKEVLGFDIEWQPWASASSIKKNVSLIQIASEDRVALFHISLFPGKTADELMPATLKSILENPGILKVGVAIKGDFSRVEKYLSVRARGVFEISRLHNLVENYVTSSGKVSRKLVSLASQTKHHLQLPLYKGEVRSSDWSKRLEPEQLRYAATDAYAGLRIYDVLESKRKLLRPIPPLPDFCDYDEPSRPHTKRKSIPKSIAAKDKEAVEQTDEEGTDEYETALEDFIDSHELENASESAAETSDSGVGSDAGPNSNTEGFSSGEDRIATTKRRQIGRIRTSRLRGADPGYPKLPQLPSDREDDSNTDSSSAFDPPPKTRLRRRNQRRSEVQDEVLARPPPEASNIMGVDEFGAKELDELLSTMNINDVPESSLNRPHRDLRVDHGETRPLPTPISTNNEHGEQTDQEKSNSATEKKTNKPKSTETTPTTSDPAPLHFTPLPPDNAPKGPEYAAAETWARTYLTQSIPSASWSSPSPPRIRATLPHLRAYHMWHHQRLSLDEIAAHLRDPPLAASTVSNYIVQAVDLERLEYRDTELREILQGMSPGLLRGRYARLVGRLGGTRGLGVGVCR